MEQKLLIKNLKSTEKCNSEQYIEVKYRITPMYALRQYFEKFGTFRNFETAYERNPLRRKLIKKIFIRYVDPETTARVLLKKYYFVENEIVIVKRKKNWQELNKEMMPETESNNSEIAHSTDDGMNILDLPEFCLEAILERMEPCDQIRFVQSHKIIETVFETYCRREYKKFIWNKTKGMSLVEVRDFLRIAGKYMVELHGEIRNKYCDDVTELIYLYCPNIEKVTLAEIYVNPKSFQKFLRSLPNLRELNLTYCQLDDNALVSLKEAKNLRVLRLSNMFHISGKNLHSLTQLEHVSLHHCWLIKNNYLIKLCEALRNLRSLDIRGLYYIKPSFYDIIDIHCRRLEVLKMTAPNFNFDRVALLPRLKHLEITYPSTSDGFTIIPQLAQHKADQLEVLQMYSRNRITEEDMTSLSELRELKVLSIGFNRNAETNAGAAKLRKLRQLEELTIDANDRVTGDELLNLVKSCLNLHILNIQNCDKVTSDFIANVAPLTRYRHRKLTIYTYGTLVQKKQLIQLPAYKDAVECLNLYVEFEISRAGLIDYDHIFSEYDRELYECRFLEAGLCI